MRGRVNLYFDGKAFYQKVREAFEKRGLPWHLIDDRTDISKVDLENIEAGRRICLRLAECVYRETGVNVQNFLHRLGTFITFEGPDGSGKTTQIKLAAARFEAMGYQVVLTREPGGTEIAEKIRDIVLTQNVLPMTELLLFQAARYEHVQTKIMPALKESKVVLCDRFMDTTYAYQGVGRGMLAEVSTLTSMVLGGFKPDFTLYFRVSPEAGLSRLEQRKQATGEVNRLDSETVQFITKCHQGYEEALQKDPKRMHIFDAEQPIARVADDVRAWIDNNFKNYNAQI